MTNDFAYQNSKMWTVALNAIFGDNIPTRYDWINLMSINDVLNKISGEDINHVLYPAGGCNDMLESTVSQRYPGCLELSMDGGIHICSPLRLTFDNVANDPNWCYFRLELKQHKPSGVYDNSDDVLHEQLLETEDGELIEYDDFPPIGNYRQIMRLLGGTLLIVMKASHYNNLPSTYDGIHNPYSRNMFRELMEHMRGKRSIDGLIWTANKLREDSSPSPSGTGADEEREHGADGARVHWIH